MKADRRAQSARPRGMSLANSLREAKGGACPPFLRSYKESIGNYQDNGKQWRKTRTADKVNELDFSDPDVLRAYPYGIYGLGCDKGFVNLGTDHDACTFSARVWIQHVD